MTRHAHLVLVRHCDFCREPAFAFAPGSEGFGGDLFAPDIAPIPGRRWCEAHWPWRAMNPAGGGDSAGVFPPVTTPAAAAVGGFSQP